MRRIEFAARALVAFGCLTGGPVQAQRFEQTDRAAIEARVAAFDAATRAGRYADILEFMPPRLFDGIAQQAKVTPDQLKATMAEQIGDVFKTVKILSFGMDIKGATSTTTPDGKRDFLLIPTETVMEIPDGRRLKSKSTTVALKDGGTWYLVRVDNAQQILMLTETYPEFAGVDFPSGSTAAVD